MESGNRRFSPKRQEGRVGLSEGLLESYGDFWCFADEGVLKVGVRGLEGFLSLV